MIKRWFAALLLTLALVLTHTPSVLAQEGQPPVGTCPSGFVLHEFHHHEGEHEHHIGLAQDLNGNGMICVKHLANGLHVHVDDVVSP
jgi:hypothetical protein